MGEFSAADLEAIRRLESIIEHHINDDQFSVEELAKESNMSRSKIHRLLEKTTGQSTSQFIREYRLKKAYDLLANKEGNVSEIAFKVGFNSLTYFSSSFTEFYGFRPSEAHEHFLQESAVKRAENQEKENKFPGKIAVVSILLLIGFVSYFILSIIKKAESPFFEAKSIAVLPLENLTGDDNNDHFVDGLHDALIGELGQLSDLQVISRTSALQFKEPKTSISDIASRLQVQNIIEGSVYQAGDSIRIQLQLIQVFPAEKHIWSENFDRKAENILSLFNEVTRKVAGSINLVLNPADSTYIFDEPTVHPEAYRNLVIANNLIYSRKEEDIIKAVELLKRSIELDPEYADAHSSLAFAYGLWNQYGFLDQQECFRQMQKYIDNAFELDSENGMAYLASSYLAHKKGERDERENFAKRAIELMPNNAQAHFDYSEYLRVNSTEENDKEELSKKILKKAYLLDPLHPWIATRYAEHFYEFEGDKDEAMRRYNELIALYPDFAIAYQHKAFLLATPPYGELDNAFINLYEAWRLNPDSKYLASSLIFYGVAMDWKEWTMFMLAYLEDKNPDNPQILFWKVLNAARFKDYNTADSLLVTLNQLYPDYSESISTSVFRTNIAFYNGRIDESDALFKSANPDISDPDSMHKQNNTALLYYAKLLNAKGDSLMADRYVTEACKRIEAMEVDPDNFITLDEKLSQQSICYVVLGNFKEAAEIIETQYFTEKITFNWPGFFSFIYFDEFHESEEFAPTRERIYNDLHRMRGNVMAYLKEQGAWRLKLEPEFAQ